MDTEREYVVTRRMSGVQTWLIRATSAADAIRRADEDGDPVGFEIDRRAAPATAEPSGRF